MNRKPKASEQTQVFESPVVKAATLALQPSVNAAAVVQSYSGKTFGQEPDINALVDNLLDSFTMVQGGDLGNLEAMLVGQATALQSLFTSLARRAQAQTSQRNLEAFLGLAFKAQAQSRATISAVVELRYPRQVAFVKQANISHGPQQVNNGPANAISARSRTEENQSQQNKLLEDHNHGRTYLDTGATTTAGRSHPAVETVEAVHRAKKRRGESEGIA